MNDLTEKLSQVSLERIEKYLNSAESFASEQVPLLVQEIIRWELVSNCFYLCLLSFIFLVFLYISYFLVFKTKFSEERLMYALICAFASVCSLIFILQTICDIAYVLLAPRMFLLEKMRDFINNGV